MAESRKKANTRVKSAPVTPCFSCQAQTRKKHVARLISQGGCAILDHIGSVKDAPQTHFIYVLDSLLFVHCHKAVVKSREIYSSKIRIRFLIQKNMPSVFF